VKGNDTRMTEVKLVITYMMRLTCIKANVRPLYAKSNMLFQQFKLSSIATKKKPFK